MLAPIFLETVVVLFYCSNFLAAAAYLTFRGGGAGNYIAFSSIFLNSWPYLIMIHTLRKNFVQKHRLFSQFENFDLDKVECSNESDRNFVYSAIEELYGSNEAFTSYVKGPLREELLGPIAHSGPQKYALLILSPLVSMNVELLVALWRGWAPVGVILLFVVAVLGLGVCLFLRTSIELALLLCDHFAEPMCQSLIFESRPVPSEISSLKYYFSSSGWQRHGS